MSRRRIARHAILAAVAAAGAIAVLSQPPIDQDPAYHLMADRRALFGIPNALNVLSNIPFAVAGVVGLLSVFSPRPGAKPFTDPWERWPYAALFAGTALTTIGSAYYHLAPDNARLVWDRLPMTVGFMGLLTSVVAERSSLPVARRLFVPLLACGGASVVYWYWSELRGAGDLRPYALAQFGSLAVVLVLLALYDARYSGSVYLWAGLAAYGSAKLFEMADRAFFDLGHLVSGHTLKHLAAALGVGCVVVMLRTRGPTLRGHTNPEKL
jgi:hypothetical protein